MAFDAVSRKAAPRDRRQTAAPPRLGTFPPGQKSDSVIIATDDMRIAKAAFSWGAEVALTSPKHRSGTERVAEVAKKTGAFGYIVNIQGDEPLISPQLIDAVVEKLRGDRSVGIVTAAHPFTDPREALSPHQVKVVVDLRGNALYFSRAP